MTVNKSTESGFHQTLHVIYCWNKQPMIILNNHLKQYIDISVFAFQSEEIDAGQIQEWYWSYLSAAKHTGVFPKQKCQNVCWLQPLKCLKWGFSISVNRKSFKFSLAASVMILKIHWFRAERTNWLIKVSVVRRLFSSYIEDRFICKFHLCLSHLIVKRMCFSRSDKIAASNSFLGETVACLSLWLAFFTVFCHFKDRRINQLIKTSD